MWQVSPVPELPDVKVVRVPIFRDDRGFFSETHNVRAMEAAGLQATFIQDNHALSAGKGVVRGLHFQVPPKAQDKLIRVSRGAILDVVVDIRVGSPTYGRHASIVLSADNWLQLWVPKGFAHGYCTLEPDTEVIYKVTDYYAADHEGGIRWDDPALGIAWPVGAAEAILSAKDKAQPLLSELKPQFSIHETKSAGA